MFRILMPVDFSVCSLNALTYALQMSKALKADMTLLHVVEPIGGDATMFIDGRMIEEEIEGAKERLIALRDNLKDKEGTSIETIVRTGFPVDQILEMTDEKNISLIIMGTEGSRNKFQDLIGSNTYNVVKKADCAVLTVPIQAEGFDVKKIGLAVALQNNENMHMLTILKHIARHFNAEIILLHVSEDKEHMLANADSDLVLWLSEQFKDFANSFVTFPSEDVAEAISDYAMNNNINLLAITPQHHDLFSLLFKGSITRKLVLHAHIPVLTLPADF